MSKKVLILKQGGVQQFQNIGGKSGPSFMDLARRVRDPTASGWQKVLAGAGMAGKTAAGIGAINQTAHQMQGGNAFAPLNINYAYQGLDPTTGMQANVTPGEQQDEIIRRRLKDGAETDLNALTDANVNVRALAAKKQQLPPPAGLPAQTPVPAETSAGHQYQPQWTNAGRTGTPPPTYDPFAAQRNAAIQRGPPGLNQPVQAQTPPVQAQPATSSEPLHPLGPQYNTGGAGGPAAQPVQPNTLNPNLSEVVARVNVPSNTPAAPATATAVSAPQAPVAVSNPYTGLPPQATQLAQNLIQGRNTGQGPVNPQNSDAMINAGKNLAQQSQQPQPQPQYAATPPPLPSPPVNFADITSYGDSPASTSSAPVSIKPYQHTGFSNIHGTPGNVNPQQPQQDPTFGGRVNEAELKIDGVNYFTQAAFDAVLEREGLKLAKSFVQAIYDEMGDALYKADPHVAGLIISRIYMDKFVR